MRCKGIFFEGFCIKCFLLLEREICLYIWLYEKVIFGEVIFIYDFEGSCLYIGWDSG